MVASGDRHGDATSAADSRRRPSAQPQRRGVGMGSSHSGGAVGAGVVYDAAVTVG